LCFCILTLKSITFSIYYLASKVVAYYHELIRCLLLLRNKCNASLAVLFSHSASGSTTKRVKKSVPSFNELEFPRLGTKSSASRQSDSESDSEDDEASADALTDCIDHSEMSVVSSNNNISCNLSIS